MQFIRILVVLAITLLSSTAMAAVGTSLPTGMTTIPLATITNDRDTSISKINLILGKQAIVRGISLTTSTAVDDAASRQQSRIYWLDRIESGRGVVLGQGQGVKAIYLRGKIQSRNGQGSLVVSYLANGIFRNYDQCRINLQRVAPYRWQLINTYNGQPIDHIEVQTWALGISTLKNVCPTA